LEKYTELYSKNEELKSSIVSQKAFYSKIIESKDSSISTLNRELDSLRNSEADYSKTISDYADQYELMFQN